MIRSLGRAENAMLLQQVRIDTLANNLANVNTVGFRQVLMRTLQSTPRADGSGGLQLPPGRVVAPTMMQATDMRPGPVKPTGRDTDIALMGPGFFVVQTPDGDRYTRAGSFSVNDQKQLITPEGYLILGDNGPIVMGRDSFAVGNDGTISVDGKALGRLRIVDFEDASVLQHEGANRLLAPDDLEPVPVPEGQIAVAQGHVESSNVNAVQTLVAMITAQRAFEVQTKVLTTEDGMLDKSVNTMSRVGRG